MKTLYGIQYLRAFAALAVVCFHAAERNGLHFAIGAAGVDVFFVISGFIMWVIADRRQPSVTTFLADRLRRIVPIYWLATLVMIAGGLAGLFPNLVLGLGHVLGSLLFLPVASPSTGALWPVLVQGWTLNYEMFFYAVFALTLVLPKSTRLATVAVIFGSLVLIGHAFDLKEGWAAFYTRPILLEFVAGMALGALWSQGRTLPLALGVAAVVLSLLGFAAIHLLGLAFDEWRCGPLALALVAGMLSIEAHGRMPKIDMATLLGNASYSIYLWHTFAISVMVKVGNTLGLPVALTLVGAILSGTLAGLLAWRLVEQPLQAHLGRRRPQAATA